MTDIPTPAPVPAPENVKADPRRPYKAYIGMAVALIGLIWANLEGRDNLDNMTVMEWLSIFVPALLTFGAVYGTENPKVVDTNYYDDRGAADPAMLLIIVGVVMVVVALLFAKLAFLLWFGIVIAIVGVLLLVLGRART